MRGEQTRHMPEGQLEKTRPDKGRSEHEVPKKLELVKIEPAEGRFVSGQALFRRQELKGGGWKDQSGPNQDTVLRDSKQGIFGVFDGMGGTDEGAEASVAARDAFQEEVPRRLEQPFRLSPEMQEKFAKSREGIAEELSELRRYVEETLDTAPLRFASEQDVEQALIEGAKAANKAIAKKAPKGDTTVSLMATYETADGELGGKIVNRGDSRVYRYRNGKLDQLTQDDSHIQFLADSGLIKKPDDLEEVLSDKARELIGRAFGVVLYKGDRIKDIRHYVTAGLEVKKQAEDARITDTDLKAGDLVVCVTDGVVDNLSDQDLKTVIETGKPDVDRPSKVATSIAKEAQTVAQGTDLRAKQDDIGVVITRIQDAPTLENIFESDYTNTEEFMKEVESNGLLTDLTWELGMVRNQADLAVESNPDNVKMKMLRDHIIDILHLVGDRQAELRNVELAVTRKATPDKGKKAAA